MERHQIQSKTINWQELIQRVVQDQVELELTEGEIAVARLVPVGKRQTLVDLDNALRQLPPLRDDAASFESDVAETRASMKPLDDPWEF